METQNDYYAKRLKEELGLRQRSNSRYSLRAFSRDLEMNPATLSMVLQGKRPLPVKHLKKIIESLELTPVEETMFRESLHRTKTKLDAISVNKEQFDKFMLDESYYKVIAEWEHYGVITLMETDNFKSNLDFIAERLEIAKDRVEVVMNNLIKAGLVKVDSKGSYILTKGPLCTTEDISSRALKKSHKETMDMGKAKLEELDPEHRDFSSLTIAVDPKKVREAKTIIREFRKKMASLLDEGDKTEVYQMAIQFYPLTKIDEIEKYQ